MPLDSTSSTNSPRYSKPDDSLAHGQEHEIDHETTKRQKTAASTEEGCVLRPSRLNIQNIAESTAELVERVEAAKANPVLQRKGLWDYDPENTRVYSATDNTSFLEKIKGLGTQTHKPSSDLWDFTKDQDYQQRQVALYGPPASLNRATLNLPKRPPGLTDEEARHIWMGEGRHAFRLKADDGVTEADIARDLEQRVRAKQTAIEAYGKRKRDEAEQVDLLQKQHEESVYEARELGMPEPQPPALLNKTAIQILSELKEWIELQTPEKPGFYVPPYADRVAAEGNFLQQCLAGYKKGLFHHVHKPVLTTGNPRHPQYSRRMAFIAAKEAAEHALMQDPVVV